jgi:uncharacterized protein (DUF58 family)
MNTVRINPYPILLVSFLLMIFYLAGMSFGGVLYFLFFVLLFVILVSWAHVLYSYRHFRFHQEFANDHPVKGDIVKYKLILENESMLPNPCVHASFKSLGAHHSQLLKPFSLHLKKKTRFVKEVAILCPYRGVYEVGLDSISVSDLFGWIEFKPEVWHRTFYVYPRVIGLKSLFLDVHSQKFAGGLVAGAASDIARFKGLDQYREGLPIKQIYWKKYMALGEPYLKTHETASYPGIELYLDLRRTEDAAPSIYEREDASVEIAIAIAKYLLDNAIPVSFHAIGKERCDFNGVDSSLFQELLKATIHFFFAPCGSPLDAYRVDRRERGSRMKTALFITHLLDPELFDAAARTASIDDAIHVVVNQIGMGSIEKSKCDQYRKTAIEKGGSIRLVEGSETIRRDLEQNV